MSRRRGRGQAASGHDDEHVDERWLVSYADMITVLMCLFIVLFAMSTVDSAKYDLLKHSLATGFGATPSNTADTATGVVVPEHLVDENGAGFTAGETDATGNAALTAEQAAELAAIEAANLGVIKAKVDAALAAQGLAGTVEYQLDERGLTIRLVGSETFFSTNSIDLSATAIAVLHTIGPIVAGTTYGVSVEGHADARASTYPFPTNWELSSGRATEVLRFLVEKGGVSGERIGATGYGSTRPLSTGAADADLATNRRVDIVVLSDQPDVVRNLIEASMNALASPASALASETSSTKPAPAVKLTEKKTKSSDTSDSAGH